MNKLMNLKNAVRAALVASAVAATSAFAQTAADPVSQVQTAVSTQIGNVSAFVITLGIAIIGIAFATYVLKKGKHAAGGGV
jgi:type IV secretory pathway VirB2 component (pilin)